MPLIVLAGEPITDGVTSLRPWRDSDLDAIVAACQDAEIARWTTVPSPYGSADARAFLHQRHAAIHASRSAPFAIVAPDDGALLGSIALMRPAWKHARIEVGYWLAREARGAGHATRALRLICGWGFSTLALERVELLAATGNVASQRVAERAGFTPEATLRSYIRAGGDRHDMLIYGLLADDPGGRPSHGRAVRVRS